jgi:hypothetical protein
VLRTVHPQAHLAARVRIPQTIPARFAVWELSRFLAALAMFPKPKLIFGDKDQVEIRDAEGEAGALVMRYPLTDRDCVRTFDKEPNVDPTFVFPLSKERLKLFINLGGRLDLPHLILVGNGTSIVLGAADAAKPEPARVSGKMPVGNSDVCFQAVFAAEDWHKLLKEEDYHVGIALRDGDKTLAHFIGADGDVHYWMGSRTDLRR